MDMTDHHGKLERHSIRFVIAILCVASLGGLFEIAPLFTIDSTIEEIDGVRPYTPLELAGRNIYMREGCYSCHSQMIRTLRDEVERYGHYSLAAESKYDHPMLWGSKRTGPDLARVGGKYSDDWHLAHLIAPRDIVVESIMPGYAFLADRSVDVDELPLHLRALQTIGVPYDDDMIAQAAADAHAQVRPDSEPADELLARYGDRVNVREFDSNPGRLSEMDALIAYLQMLGTLADIESFEPIGPAAR